MKKCFTTYGTSCKEPEPLPECPVVEIDQGNLKGKTCLDKNKGLYFSYMSIPYAKPPLGKLRFMPPKPAEPWNGMLDASKDMPSCIQQVGLTKATIGVEDCLFLNVHTTQIPTKSEKTKPELKPVMFYIHGGGFVNNSGRTDWLGAEFLMPYEVVLVTINYRLGLLGFASSTENVLDVFGNMGLKDQVMALKWTKRNISKFGGNPDNVLIFGESAGGACVNFHVLSPMSKGLFHKAFSMSGNALCAWCNGRKGTFEDLARKLEIPTCNKLQMLRTLQALPVEQIVATQKQHVLLVPIHEVFDYSPVIETQTNEDAFLPASPLDIYKSGNYNHVPYIIGYTNLDGLLFEVISRLNTGKPFILDDMSYVIPNDLILHAEDTNSVKNKIKKFYFEDEEPCEQNLRKFCDLATDVWIMHAVGRTVKALVQNNDRVYLYQFVADTNLNFFKALVPETNIYSGACHVDDLGYIFKTNLTSRVWADSIEDKAIDTVITLWTNFAKYGKPTTLKSFAKWLPVSKLKKHYLEIGTELREGLDPDQARFDFWESLYNEYGKEEKELPQKDPLEADHHNKCDCEPMHIEMENLPTK